MEFIKELKTEKKNGTYVKVQLVKLLKTEKVENIIQKSKFVPLDADDVDSNTEMQEKAKGYIITREVFGLNDITRPMAEKIGLSGQMKIWIRWKVLYKNRCFKII